MTWRVRDILAKVRGSGAMRKGSWGLADQMLISLTNFVTMVLLARGLGPEAFGVFTLVYGAMLFANSFQSALIIQPHCVLSASRTGAEYATYTLSSALIQLAFALIVSALALLAAGVSQLAGWDITHLLLALAPCAGAWQLQEFVRRVLYNEMRFRAALFNDIISYGGQMAAVGALWWFEKLNGVIALHAITVPCLLASLVGAWRLRDSLRGRFERAALVENWHFGKWLAGAEMGNWLSSQIYFYLAGMILGSAATGTLKAAYVIFGPLRIIGFFLKSVLPNRFARTLASRGTAAMADEVRLVYWMIAPFMGSFCLLVAIFAGPILKLLYGAEYSNETGVLMLYAIFAFVAFMAQIVACALRAKRLTKRLFASQAYATLVALPVGWIIITLFDVHGAAIGMILTSLVVNFSNWRAYRRELQKDSAEPAIAASPQSVLGAQV